ncbi:hypothetical protein D9757_000236 [Collybiopsis confluens]|uniref:WKF domain-containing protein n=1 Tax=Collybiopsis confluens TaxID=2823264 RepID=A0A8H5MH55_9AGAR|nr:hypothetical protein D9757_000236 [Collybiopsis confluens]
MEDKRMRKDKKERKERKEKKAKAEDEGEKEQQMDLNEEAEGARKKDKKLKKPIASVKAESRAQLSEDAVPVEGKERKKKRKRDEEVEPVDVEPKKKKNSKNKTGLTDPEDEPSLSDQARKALLYAFQQFRKPSAWKFQKARQNWIIRNVWSPENIPDSQMPLVLKYLSGVQGNIREALTKTCDSIIKEASRELASNAKEPDKTEANAAIQPDKSKKVLRAEVLLATLKGGDGQ